MLSLQFDRHALHCVFGVRLKQFKQFHVAHVPNHPIRLWTERVVCLVLSSNLVEHVGLGGSQFSGTILERLHSAHASQRGVITLEFGSPCSPRSALSAHDLNRHGLQRVAPIYHEVFRLQRWILCFHDKNVFGNHQAHFLCLFQQRVALIYHVPVQRRDSYFRQINVCGFYPFPQRVTTIYPKKPFHREKNVHRSPENGTFFFPSCTVLVPAPTTGWSDLSVLTMGCSDLSRLGFGIGWFDWKHLDCCTTCHSGRWACSEPNSLFQSWFKEIFGGGRGDMYTFFVHDFSSFHPNNFRHNNFWNTISWKCFMKNDGVRSSSDRSSIRSS